MCESEVERKLIVRPTREELFWIPLLKASFRLNPLTQHRCNAFHLSLCIS